MSNITKFKSLFKRDYRHFLVSMRPISRFRANLLQNNYPSLFENGKGKNLSYLKLEFLVYPTEKNFKDDLNAYFHSLNHGRIIPTLVMPCYIPLINDEIGVEIKNIHLYTFWFVEGQSVYFSEWDKFLYKFSTPHCDDMAFVSQQTLLMTQKWFNEIGLMSVLDKDLKTILNTPAFKKFDLSLVKHCFDLDDFLPLPKVPELEQAEHFQNMGMYKQRFVQNMEKMLL